MESIGVGLIGTGYMGKCHALAWNAVHGVFGDGPVPSLVQLAEIDPGLAATRAAELGFARSTGDWHELIADPDVGVVSITTPNAFHAQMAIAALEAGKHVWCEKPMAASLGDAVQMCEAARASGRTAILGYNYIQNPVIREIERLVLDGAIGKLNHFRVEMDEDFMADPEAPFHWKNAATSGHGVLDDFGVHALSLIETLLGRVRNVLAHQSRPFTDRPTATGGRAEIETRDVAGILVELASGASGIIALNRATWGRKGRLALQIFGDAGSILYDQERMNQFRIYRASGPLGEQGYSTILSAPEHPPYARFVPAPGHGLGFNDLKVIECRELLHAIVGEPARVIDFDAGLRIEHAVDAMARSHQAGAWTEVGGTR